MPPLVGADVAGGAVGGALDAGLAVMGESETYLRYSLGSEADALQASHDYESGLELPGLSVAPLTPPAWWSRPVPDWLARQICKYAQLAAGDGSRYAGS